MPCLRGFPGRVPGDALFTRGSEVVKKAADGLPAHA